MSTPAETAKVRQVGTLTISNGTANSNVLTADDFAKYGAITIVAPATLPESISPQVPDADTVAPNFATLQSPPGTDIVIAAAKAVEITALAFPQLRLRSTAGNVGADRVFTVWGKLDVVVSP